MERISFFDRETINQAFAANFRQYFVGDLRQKQDLEHITDSAIEFGLSRYEEDILEKAHYHEKLSEYQYIIKGQIMLYDLDNLVACIIKAGEFYGIPQGVSHCQFVKAGTEIIFVKNKSLNDKHLIELTSAQEQLIARERLDV